jgi:DNA-binding transcriptional ArsR family regulator
VAISNRRLISLADGRVTFERKDYATGNQTKTMTLEAVEFIRRFLLHVPPSGFPPSGTLGSSLTAIARKSWAAARPPLPVYTLTRICSVEYMKRVESVFEIIAEPNRRAILSLLVSSQQSVGEIERQLRMPQPTVSKHLRVLRDAGFVESTVDAQRRLYRLKPEPLQEMDAWLAQFRRFWSAHVDALERHLDRMDQKTPTKRKTKEKTTRPKPRT